MKFDKIVSLAPMARITDVAFRSLCKELGANMTVSELTSSEGIIRGQENSLKQIVKADNEDNFSIQLFGGNPKSMGKAASLIEKQCTTIDVNMGCPVTKVTDQGAGCQLTSNPKLAGEVVKRIVDSVSIPVSAKIRLGISKPDKAIQVAKQVENNGASFITVHGRTQIQGYSGKANWNIIKQVRESVSIPIIGNGDITSPEIAKKRLDDFTPAGIAIGRGSSGNPFLFSQIKEFLSTESYTSLTNSKRIELFNKYLKLANKYSVNFLNQKLQAQHITKGIKGATKTRLELNNAKNQEELKITVKKILE